jgi:hypothetical protein
VRLKFAEPLKAMATTLLMQMGFDADTRHRMLEGDLKEQPIPGLVTATPRNLMQTLGTNWGREAMEKNLWTSILVKRAQAEIVAGKRVVVDDTRFPNELAALKHHFPDTLAVMVVRPDAPKSSGHGTYEGLLTKADHDVVLLNDETIPVLRDSIDIMMALAP